MAQLPNFYMNGYNQNQDPNRTVTITYQTFDLISHISHYLSLISLVFTSDFRVQSSSSLFTLSFDLLRLSVLTETHSHSQILSSLFGSSPLSNPILQIQTLAASNAVVHSSLYRRSIWVELLSLVIAPIHSAFPPKHSYRQCFLLTPPLSPFH